MGPLPKIEPLGTQSGRRDTTYWGGLAAGPPASKQCNSILLLMFVFHIINSMAVKHKYF